MISKGKQEKYISATQNYGGGGFLDFALIFASVL